MWMKRRVRVRGFARGIIPGPTSGRARVFGEVGRPNENPKIQSVSRVRAIFLDGLLRGDRYDANFAIV